MIKILFSPHSEEKTLDCQSQKKKKVKWKGQVEKEQTYVNAAIGFGIIYLYNSFSSLLFKFWLSFCCCWWWCVRFPFFAIFLYENIVIKINACAPVVVLLPFEIGNAFGLCLCFFFQFTHLLVGIAVRL